MRSEFEKWFKTTDIYESFIRYWNEEQVFRTGENGEDLDSTVNSLLRTWQHQQTKVDDLEHENTLLRNRVSALESKLRVYPKYVQQLKDRNAELQKQVDAVKQLITYYKDPSITSDKSFQHRLLLVVMELEQALKGDKE